uniref:Hexosyltransferase n=1 Tax=Cyclophora tenuis TaxID=216820 RepID=A0A7S1GJD2_CYCTE|mmetsp:Transcript_20044/g.34242  ORF Transcript_20044/g.34242 Transcript_20044/m.34242 type:complete len:411 (+) Transcript_20044:74-1306(+)|eukprot:CAMPEP_0116548522 /NCGR_PEP_ID=MMETSP0397-20121206/4379_1 /TAXON_ID=216820 /ORGANISM="Cyclophora tenuis, Strain ECT3854" /LENGTH=410 /DNA_ID=CAMNT_0004073173 /DNA_START=25 /DNA_END=1257 /DNA_ORIENTATION=+
MTEEVIDVPSADVVPLYPPRPDAFVTLLTSGDHLAGAQTLFYSIKKTLSKDLKYPPELVVLVTPNVSSETRVLLCPVFCTRVLEVDPIAFPRDSLQFKQHVSSRGDDGNEGSHVPTWTAQGALTKLNVFNLAQYDTVVYIDADCLVIKDVAHLLELGKVYQESEALIAAAPDIMPPDKFNAGVMVIRPSEIVFKNMLAQRSLLTTYDGGDTGFLNAYFSEWYTEMPPMARLSFGYNAQRFLYHCTYEKQPKYWDLAVSPDLHIIHYSSLPKPWDSKPAAVEQEEKVDIESHLDQEDVRKLRKVQKSSELESLWWKWYQRSKNYTVSYAKEVETEEHNQKEQVAAARKAAVELQRPKTQKEIHKLVAAKYKELRKEGKSPKDAMDQSRREYGQDKEEASPNRKVASMFGVS